MCNVAAVYNHVLYKTMLFDFFYSSCLGRCRPMMALVLIQHGEVGCPCRRVQTPAQMILLFFNSLQSSCQPPARHVLVLTLCNKLTLQYCTYRTLSVAVTVSLAQPIHTATMESQSGTETSTPDPGHLPRSRHNRIRAVHAPILQ